MKQITNSNRSSESLSNPKLSFASLSNTKILSAIILMSVISVLGGSDYIQTADAVVTCEISGDDVTFITSCEFATNTTVLKGDIWSVDEDVTLTIPSGVTIENYGTIILDESTAIINNYGTINNNIGATIMNNYGDFNNYGTINNYCTGIISGTITNNPPVDICGFSGDYDPGNWTFSSSDIVASVDTTNAPDFIILYGPNAGDGDDIDADFTITIPSNGVISFDWVFDATDDGPEYENVGYVLNGVYTRLSDVPGEEDEERINDIQSGSVINLKVNAGDVFAFRVNSTDSCCGVGIFTISNFLGAFSSSVEAEPEPEPTTDKKGGGCADCEAPTLGLDSNYKRIVENGFTYNGKSVDAERFFTPYPLITVNIGETNTAVFKIYENQGIQNIKHFSFAFGLDTDDVISNSKAMIELDIDYDGTETVTVTDPKNTLDNITVTTNVVECMAGSTAECLEVTINHMFRAPLDFNIVATDVWDQKRNGWQNYFNHGIEVIGESMNPPEEYNGINRGQIYHLTETSKTSAVDEFGNNWTLQYDTWMMDYIKAERLQDAPTKVFTRMHSEFAGYKETQIRDAIEQLLVLCPTCLDDSYTDFDDSWSYEIPVILSKLQDPEIQQRMILENEKAQEIMDNIQRLSDRSSVNTSKYFEERDFN